MPLAFVLYKLLFHETIDIKFIVRFYETQSLLWLISVLVCMFFFGSGFICAL